MDHAFKSITGRRPNNEDRCRTEEKEGGFLLLVLSDGMGGHAAGEIAGQMTVDAVAGRFAETQRPASTDFLEGAILTANLDVYRMAGSAPQYAGMGATVVCAVIGRDGNVYCANVGDSRLYRIHDGAAEQITHDHSLVQELIDMGRITEEEALVHPHRNIITRSVGSGIRVDASTYTFAAAPGDWILLCSDGLSGVLSAKEIAAAFASPGTAAEKAEFLVGSAYDAGSHDNITVCLAQFPEASE